jgi:hypothetical protein
VPNIQQNLNVTNTLVIERWWVATPGGVPRGPWPLERVISCYAAGALDARAQVRPEGSRGWIPIARVLPEVVDDDLEQTPLALTSADEEAIEEACAMKKTAEWPLAKPWPDAAAWPNEQTLTLDVVHEPLFTLPPTTSTLRPQPPPAPVGEGRHVSLRNAALLGATVGALGALGGWVLQDTLSPPLAAQMQAVTVAAGEPPVLPSSESVGASMEAAQPPRPPPAESPIACERAKDVPMPICAWLVDVAAGRSSTQPPVALVRQFLATRGATPTVGRVIDRLNPVEPGVHRYLVTSQNVYGYCLSTRATLEKGTTYARWVMRSGARLDATGRCLALEDAPLDGAIYTLAFQSPSDPSSIARSAIELLAEQRE